MSDATMQIEALEKIKSQGHVLDTGDRVTVPQELGKRWIDRGWAKDPAGEIPTGERRVVAAVVDPENVRHKAQQQEAK